MEHFSLEKWLQDKSRKVVTRGGRPVTIVCPKSPYDTIVGFCGKDQYPDLWDLNGKYLKDRDSDFDLFFADEEEELTEFEKAMQEYYFPELDDFDSKRFAKGILDLARKELLKDLPKWKKITKSEQNYLAYGYLSHDGYYLSIQELKDKLPKEE